MVQGARGAAVEIDDPSIRSSAKSAAAESDAAQISLGPLSGFVGYALRRAQLAVFDAFTNLLSQFDIKPGEFGVLIVIENNPGLRATDVCNALGFQKANFAPLIRRLELRGLVKRTDSRDDKRTQRLTLTAAGRRLLEKALKVHQDHEVALLQALGTANADRLIAQLNKLAKVY